MNTTDKGWHPPHCPNPNCKHHNAIHDQWPYRKHGFFHRRITPHRIQRFTCLACGRSFSSQTFSVTYWLKRPDILFGLMTKIAGGMANRQIAYDMRANPNTVDRQLSRLGRHCLLFHTWMTRNQPPPQEIAFDGFESFELSQYYPFQLHIVLEPANSFINSFTDSELRRKGRMTAYQKKRRAELEAQFGRPDPKAVEKDITLVLKDVLAGADEVVVRSDLHQAYPRAMRRVPCNFQHRKVSSKGPRNRSNLLWEINRVDRMLRHCQSGHARETLAWPKRRQRAAERFAIFLVWWNYVRSRWMNRSRSSPAMEKGLCRKQLRVQDVLAERLFPSLVSLSERWREYYRGQISTRAISREAGHRLVYAD